MSGSAGKLFERVPIFFACTSLKVDNESRTRFLRLVFASSSSQTSKEPLSTLGVDRLLFIQPSAAQVGESSSVAKSL